MSGAPLQGSSSSTPPTDEDPGASAPLAHEDEDGNVILRVPPETVLGKLVVPKQRRPGRKRPQQKVEAQARIVPRDKFHSDSKRLTRLQEIRWIYNHINIENVEPEEAPSPGVWGELIEIQENPDLRRDFYNKNVPRLVAEDKKEKEDRFKDDGSELIDFIAQVREAHRRAVSRSCAEGL